MGCSGDREKGEVFMEEKWDYVNLNDFKSESCLTPFSYFFLWVFLIVSCAVYGVDTFTAVNLLAFSRWSGRVEPVIPFRISRWIFAICILISFVLLIYRWFWAIRAIRSGSVTQSYLNPLAVRVQSFRVLGKSGQGWKRFLVFAELTKSKKGAEYVALYTYFSFHSWLNTIFADGPRQVLNAITLYSVMKLDLLPGGADAKADSSNSGVTQFFDNIKILAEENNLRAVVLFGMLFTLVIWVLSVLKLASGIVLYLIFLFHHIPTEDGSLKAYCRRKITTRLTRIVRKKVDKALAKGLKLEDRAPTKPTLNAGNSKPTLPTVDLDKTPAVTTVPLNTAETKRHSFTRVPREKAATLPNLEQDATLPNMDFDSKLPLNRTITEGSAFSESASLTGHAAGMGYSPLDRQPAPPMPMNESRYGTPAPGAYRNLTTPGPQPYRGQIPTSGPHARSNTPGASIAANQYGRSNTAGPYGQVNATGPSAAADQYGRSNTAGPYGQVNASGAAVAANQYSRSNTADPFGQAKATGPSAVADRYGRSNTTDPYGQSNSSEASVAASQYGRSNTADPYGQVNSSGPSVAANQYGRSNTADPYGQNVSPEASVAANQHGRSHTADPYGQVKAVGLSTAADNYGRSNTAGPTVGNDPHTAADYNHYGNGVDAYEEDDYEDLYDMYASPVTQQGPPYPHQVYSQDPYQASSITPASVAPAQDPYRPYSPPRTGVASQDQPYRSYTPGTTGTASQDPTYRSYTPGSTGATSQDPTYRSYTPGTTGSAPKDSYQPYTSSATPQDTTRSFAPANAGITRPPVSVPPIRTMTPTSAGTQGGYTAFNPSTSVSSQTSPPQTRRPSVPTGYQPFTRANTASPSNIHRNGPPAGYSFNRANTDRF
ncbi:hypothetical protein N7495_004168 [Penicillium taxi]|uniref:uncharacterized protein n=1 Tax=Penicillium taxi TaxID=168475 RepID=UPI0025452162|nr:uncharacterized protein N7495_004168 [Penicillium taxi]KAJ5899424.1 hypothetical protein N7495_004168 [Penicillium taxi]